MVLLLTLAAIRRPGMELVSWLTDRQLPVLVAVTKAESLVATGQNRKVPPDGRGARRRGLLSPP